MQTPPPAAVAVSLSMDNPGHLFDSPLLNTNISYVSVVSANTCLMDVNANIGIIYYFMKYYSVDESENRVCGYFLLNV